MDSLSAMARGQASKGRPLKVFDWKRAAEIIRDENPDYCEAGLAGDMEWTAGTIYANGKIIDDSYTYLASTWATPVIVVDGDERDCFVMEPDTDWDSGTKWPDEARAILTSDN